MLHHGLVTLLWLQKLIEEKKNAQQWINKCASAFRWESNRFTSQITSLQYQGYANAQSVNQVVLHCSSASFGPLTHSKPLIIFHSGSLWWNEEEKNVNYFKNLNYLNSKRHPNSNIKETWFPFRGKKLNCLQGGNSF